MTDTDKVIQVAASRIQGLTRQVNHWKDRTEELEAALGIEKAARISAEATLSGQIAKQESAYWRGLHQEAMGALAQEREHREKERDGLTTQIQDLRNEIARLRTDLRDMSERSNGSEWEQKAVELEELRAELNLVKQERDCAKDEWDREEERCKGLASDIEVLRVELRESQKEAVTARQDAVTRAEADRVRFVKLFNDRQRLQAELAVIKDKCNELRGKLQSTESESPRQNPVKVWEWVKRTSFDYCPNTKMGAVAKVVAFDDDGDYRVTINGAVVCWGPIFCTPCDPPETTQDTPEDKETAAGAVTPKPGDKVRLVRVPTQEDYPIEGGWRDSWGEVGDTSMVRGGIVNLSSGRCAVKVSSGFEWPLSCIEIVDAK